MKEVVTTEDALQRAIRIARKADCVGVDTEFLWERTYYARLGIVQLALDEEACWIIDAVAIRDLSPLGSLLSDASTTKLLHDAQQDLTLLRRATGSYPRSIFDTRLACGFAGLTASISLEAALREMLAISLPKTETRANWVNRPLTERQIHYAFDDVRYLPGLREALLRRASDRGLKQWMLADMKALDDEGLYAERDADEQYLRVRGRGHMTETATATLRLLAAWREREAARRDRPRGHIVPDAALLSMARERPAAFAGLRQCEGVSQRAARRYGQVLLRMIKEGGTMFGSEPETRPERTKGVRALATDLLQTVRRKAEDAGLDPGVVTSRTELTALLGCPDRRRLDGHRLLNGWRGELLGPEWLARFEDAR
jgi:ribonuclease D